MTIQRCPHCQNVFDDLIPMDIEPHFTMAQAASLIPTGLDPLRSFLRYHREIPARYRLTHKQRRTRILAASEIRYIRNHIERVYYPGTKQLVPIIDVTPIDETSYPTIDFSKRTERKWQSRLEILLQE